MLDSLVDRFEKIDIFFWLYQKRYYKTKFFLLHLFCSLLQLLLQWVLVSAHEIITDHLQQINNCWNKKNPIALCCG